MLAGMEKNRETCICCSKRVEGPKDKCCTYFMKQDNESGLHVLVDGVHLGAHSRHVAGRRRMPRADGVLAGQKYGIQPQDLVLKVPLEMLSASAQKRGEGGRVRHIRAMKAAQAYADLVRKPDFRKLEELQAALEANPGLGVHGLCAAVFRKLPYGQLQQLE